MKIASILVVFLLMLSGSAASAGSYQDALSEWKSHDDVADWLKSNFSFQKSRQKQIGKRLKAQGPSGLLIRNPDNFYENSSGYCADSANFAISTLNKIDPGYNARWVFIWNDAGRPNHWVAAFDYEGKLYIMDYGTGRKWSDMQGVHGPYDSLDEYRDFLASLDMPRFKVGEVTYRDMPGEED
jgi:hypothetical protein